ncbi:MAG TPA: hypothetical protein VNJ07_03415, partial [Chitinophagales bacterium]|nr:hypothetical protein [Chitinophagales bacterium]
MKRLTTLIVCLAAASSLMLIILLNQGLLSDKPLSEQERLMQSPAYRLAQEYKKKHGEKEDDEKAAREGMLYLTEMRANHITGKINPADVLLARQQMYQKRAQKNKRGIPLNLQWEDQGPDNVGGRTRGFMIDRNNPQHILAGSVSGGLFVSYNEGLSWQPHPSNEVMGHLGILTIRQASNGDIYIGTGESFAPVLSGIPTDFGAPGFIGEGIYKSTDGGQTFFHLSSTTPSVSNSNTADWAYVNEIAIDPNNPQRVYASTNNGLK